MIQRSMLCFLASAVLVGLAYANTASAKAPEAATADAPAYEANWESLAKHTPAPEWFRDAKFGIYFHWGVYSVPAYGNEWYPNHMHSTSGRDKRYYEHHIENYGDPAEYGYDRFVQDFKAEKFDADDWAELFEKAGAKFAGPVSEHHDGYAMWDSELTPWNSMDTGPKRDITGEIATAIRKRGMKLITTFHHARNSLWEMEKDGKKQWTGHYEKAHRNFPEALEDEKRAFMYGYMPREQFLDLWVDKLKEVIDKYDPEIIWFDSWLHEIPDAEKMEFLAYYLNEAEKKDQDVVITYKQEDLPQNVGVLDLEKGGMKDKTDFAWLTDDTISMGSWCYTENLKIKEPAIVLHSFIDIVSKNGQLLLNISPKADGSIPQEQRDVLLAMGDWLGKYGESIYNTRPFRMYGHGVTTTGKGHFGGIATDKKYTKDDFRYTQNGSTVYALQLGWPGAGAEAVLKGFAKDQGAALNVKSVSMLGSDEEIKWTAGDEGLTVTSPSTAPDEMAVVYKIELAE